MTADPILYDESGPEPLVTTAGVAVLLGVSAEDIQAEMKRQGVSDTKSFRVPAAWAKAGIRRRKEYEAATGRDDMKGAIEYWASKQHDGEGTKP